MKILGIVAISFLFLCPVMVSAMGLGLGEMTGTLAIATAVQKAVEGGNYAFVAVIALMFGLELAKIFGGQRFPSVRNNAAQYSAIGGAMIGGVGTSLTGGDPVQGAIGGLLAGNAASGLYSSIAKPIGRVLAGYLRGGILFYLPLIFILGPAVFYGLYKAFKRSPREKRKELLNDFDEAYARTKDEENPSTKELEKWMSDHF